MTYIDTLARACAKVRELRDRPGMKLGETQVSVLESLYYRGPWYPGCGWTWDNRSSTTRILETLVKKGLVVKGGEIYRAVEPMGP